MKLSDLRINPNNPRTIKDAKFKKLCNSIRDFPKMMALRPIVIDRQNDNLILGGNMRYNALKVLKFTEIPDEWVRDAAELTEEEKRRFIVEDNMAFGDWDFDVLANSFDTSDLIEWGFDEKELGVTQEPVDADPQIDRAEELNQKWQVKTGDLWQIGEHRLLCGDSTKREDVERVIKNEDIRLCVTSPPYSDQREYKLGKFDFMNLYKRFMDNTICCEDILVNLGIKHEGGKVIRYWDEWLDYCENIGLPLFGWYVWDQLSGFPGDYHGRLARSHEFIFHFRRNKNEANKWIKTTGESKKRGVDGKRFRQKDGSLKEVGSPETIGQDYKIPDDVIRIRREMARGIHTESHPAVFPVEFPQFLITTWSEENEIIYDPFLGSGTTMVACQNLNRKCRGIEISPAYCSVVLERMATAFPNLKIERISNGRS